MEKHLKALGLSKLEIRTYKALLGKKGLTAKEVSRPTGAGVEASYRLLNNLINKGLIVSFGKHPARFRALPVDMGVEHLVQGFYEIGEKLATREDFRLTSSPIRVIPNRRVYHQVGQEQFDQVKKEVLVIASGTGELNPEFIETKFGAVKRGVVYKILALSLDETNREKLKSWQRTGFLVRHRSGTGVNLVVYDRKIIQMGFRVQKGFREKYGILVFNPTLAQFLGEFFDYLWEKAREVNKLCYNSS